MIVLFDHTHMNKEHPAQEALSPEQWGALDIIEQKRMLEEHTKLKCPWSDDELLGLQDHGYMLAENGMFLLETSRDWYSAAKNKVDVQSSTTNKVLTGVVYTDELERSQERPTLLGLMFEVVPNSVAPRGHLFNFNNQLGNVLPTIHDVTQRTKDAALSFAACRKIESDKEHKGSGSQE